jgi:hypothetical protein
VSRTVIVPSTALDTRGPHVAVERQPGDGSGLVQLRHRYAELLTVGVTASALPSSVCTAISGVDRSHKSTARSRLAAANLLPSAASANVVAEYLVTCAIVR